MESTFDPNGVGLSNGNLFGLPITLSEANLVLIPVPWEVTVSYNSGTANGPQAILNASPQLDFFDDEIENAWEKAPYMLPISEKIHKKSKKYRKMAIQYIEWLEAGKPAEKAAKMSEVLEKVNKACDELRLWVRENAQMWLNEGKKVAILGGDHSTPLGLFEALADKYSNFGILQIDAHMDLRDAYEDFTYSHASIMHNALKIPALSKIVQVGIRDFCEAEANFVKESEGRVKVFTSKQMATQIFEGANWKEIVNQIISSLPENVYLSFDIDGLDPALCPNTGTPVPGGLQYEQAVYLITSLRKSGKNLIGFDLNEVSPEADGDWNANVGARILYQLAINFN